ncbi:MAG TPA: DUF2085 domain-containing protein [Pyrinomonadaceae bacterium]|jgi:uncharacterized membrane protein|nr:DUF2085 domain-containing protein [Pyrinomonadaceae bacterium]
MPLSPTEYQSQTQRSRVPLLFWLGCVAIALCVISLIVGAPLAAASNHQQFAVAIYHSFKTFCHQLPERSFFIVGHQFAVCARCTGLYGGFALLLLLYPLIRSLHSTDVPKVKWLFLAAVPLGIDFSLTLFGIWENTHTSRLLTGMLLGGVTVFYVMPGILELAQRASRVGPQSTIEGTFTLVSPEAIAVAPSDYSAPQRRI